MQIQIRVRDIKVTKALQDHVKFHLSFALSRFGEQIGRVIVHLSNTEVHHSSAEKQCQITVALQRCVKVKETDADVFKAVARAADRAARFVALALTRELVRCEGTSQPRIAKRPKSLTALPLLTKRKADIKRLLARKRK
jgi:ribosomal subunit interface protein